MPLPKVALVGRPNVGKSSLLNRLARRQVSIVDPTPGVTRDRVSVIIELDPSGARVRPDRSEDGAQEDAPGTPLRLFELIDTGGYGVYTAEGQQFDDAGADLALLTESIETQIRIAIAEARLILFVTDAQSGLTSLDHAIASMLRRIGGDARVLPVANKVDGESWIAGGAQGSALGFGVPVCVSASNGYGLGTLLDRLDERIEASDADVEPPDSEMKIAVIGRRNAGKSTLINSLAGAPRVIVSEIAGTTRDSVDVRFEIDGRTMLAIDTAGVRKRKSIADDIEYYAYHRMLQAVRRADVALLLIDATTDVSQVDKKLSQELQRSFKPTVIVVSKCDLLESSGIGPEDYTRYLTEQLRGLDYAPIVFVSASRNEGLEEVVAMAFNLHQQASHREPTASLNETVQEILARRGPSSRLGTQARLLYATQVDVRPPTLVLVVNDPVLFEGRYERYLLNRLREELPFSEVPIRLLFTKRKRVGLDELKHEGKRKARS